MIDDRLQRWLDELRATAPQRWALGSIGVVAIVVAMATTIVDADQRFGWFGWFVVVTAVVAMVQAGSHTALLTIALVVVRWLGAVDDVTTPRTIIVAVCLLAFHSSLALMAVTPHTAPIAAEVLRRWARRCGLLVVATIIVWLLAHALEQRQAPADPFLTLLALGTLGAATVLLRRRSVGEPDV